MTPEVFITCTVSPALFLLPEQMDTQAARAMILTICLQESRLAYREQVKGPARGFAQFELSGIRGVLDHHASQEHIRRVLRQLAYGLSPTESYRAIKHNDVLCVCFARLLLWTLPGVLPGEHDPGEGWNQYIAAWRPGKPHPETWGDFYTAAWKIIKRGER